MQKVWENESVGEENIRVWEREHESVVEGTWEFGRAKDQSLEEENMRVWEKKTSECGRGNMRVWERKTWE
jgi:hypothetical protein